MTFMMYCCEIHLTPADQEPCPLGRTQQQAVRADHLGIVEGLARNQPSGSRDLQYLCHRVEAHQQRLQDGRKTIISLQPHQADQMGTTCVKGKETKPKCIVITSGHLPQLPSNRRIFKRVPST